MKKFLLASVCSTLLTTNVFAGGFQLSEYSVTLMGRSFAGYGIVGDDYSAIAFNPAGMSLKDSGLQAGVSMVALNSKITGEVSNNVKGKAGKLSDHPPIPHFFGQYKLNDKARIGAGAYAPFGFATDYGDKWFGRAHAIISKITVIDYNLSASYDLTQNLTLGASIIAETAKAKLTNVIDRNPHVKDIMSKITGDSSSTAFTAGLMYKIDDNTRFGISYRSQSVHKIRGYHEVELLGMKNKAKSKIVLPEYLIISGYHKMDKFGLSASVKRTKWSRFKTLDIQSYSNNRWNSISTVDEDWKDTWMFSVGVDYYYDDQLTLRTGLSYDQTGITNKSHRTARIPDANRIIAGIGASYKFDEKIQLDVAYAHVFMNPSKSENSFITNGEECSTFYAKYKSSINMVGVSLQYNF